MCSVLPNWLQNSLNWASDAMPCVSHSSAEGQQAQAQPVEEKPAEKRTESHDAPLSTDASHTEEAPAVAPPKSVEEVKTIEAGLALLKAEFCKRLEDKAAGLHTQVKGVETKIKNIDTLLSLLSKYSQKKADGSENLEGSVDCTIPEISSLVKALRDDGISVPLSDGILQKGERGHVVNVLNNHRSLLSDEQREYAQEFQQCAVERNSLFQSLMSLLSELQRVKSKIISNFTAHSG